MVFQRCFWTRYFLLNREASNSFVSTSNICHLQVPNRSLDQIDKWKDILSIADNCDLIYRHAIDV